MKTVNAFVQPAEWEQHRAVWLAWPTHSELWQENLPGAQDEFTSLCNAIADRDPETGKYRGELLEILVANERAQIDAQQRLMGLPVRYHVIPYGDIWLRDTGPIFLRTPSGDLVSGTFRFNGWGKKYLLDHDDEVALHIAEASSHSSQAFDWILEGGSVEVDGEGTILTTEQCLLNPNRNRGADKSEIELWLKSALGGERVLWIREGLLNDHTDGHIDTIARFVGPGHVVCMRGSGSDDPNSSILKQIANELRAMVDARGRQLKVTEIPSPGRVLDEDGRVMPASYVNFYIANTTVIVPTYGTEYDSIAVSELAQCFSGRKVIGSPAKTILSGGGAFHCISQQEPK